jgi:predicted dehydrogenase
VVVGGFAANKLEVWNFEDASAEDDAVWAEWAQNPEDRDYAHRQYYEHVVDCIANDRPHLVDGLEGRRSLEFISAVYESMETGLEVPLRFKAKHCRLGESR